MSWGVAPTKGMELCDPHTVPCASLPSAVPESCHFFNELGNLGSNRSLSSGSHSNKLIEPKEGSWAPPI